MSCGHCPRAGLPCRGGEVPRLCELVDPGHAAFNPAYRDLLATGTPRNPPDPDDPPDRPDRTIGPGAPGLAESLRLTAIVRRCAFRGRPACGCATALCALNGRGVTQAECLACVRRWGW